MQMSTFWCVRAGKVYRIIMQSNIKLQCCGFLLSYMSSVAAESQTNSTGSYHYNVPLHCLNNPLFA